MESVKVGLTTFIAGDAYQDYIPLLAYSIGKSYPEYHLYIFVNTVLRNDIKKFVVHIQKWYNNLHIIEHTFEDCPNMCRYKAQTLRWFLWDDQFRNLDYLYYIDSDIFYVREPIALHEQHITHMKSIGSECASNMVRKTVLSNFDYVQLGRSVKYGGFANLIRYLKTPCAMRMSGLHFVKVSTYFTDKMQKVINDYRKLLYDDKITVKCCFVNDEAILYSMMKEAGCNMNAFAIQSSSVSCFGFLDPTNHEFCPHHGFHLGIFRLGTPSTMPQWAKDQLDSDDYQYYVSKYREYAADKEFNDILAQMPERITSAVQEMNNYYGINTI